jgi:hypothetical protein
MEISAVVVLVLGVSVAIMVSISPKLPKIAQSILKLATTQDLTDRKVAYIVDT